MSEENSSKQSNEFRKEKRKGLLKEGREGGDGHRTSRD